MTAGRLDEVLRAIRYKENPLGPNTVMFSDAARGAIVAAVMAAINEEADSDG